MTRKYIVWQGIGPGFQVEVKDIFTDVYQEWHCCILLVYSVFCSYSSVFTVSMW